MTQSRSRGSEPDDDDGAEGSLRRCIATGEARSPAAMVRFVLGPDMAVVPDVAHKLAGRGYWVTSSREAIARACERGLFAKAAKSPAKCANDLADLVERLLAKRCVEFLGLARRAGQAIIGFAQVEEAFRDKRTKIAVLVEASDSGPSDRAKLLGYARRHGQIPVVGCLAQAEIGLAFGRESVVHAALTSGTLAERFMTEAERLGGFRVLCPPEWGAA